VVPCHFLISLLFVQVFGFPGVAMALTVTEYLATFCLIVYTCCIHPTARHAWGGWSWRALTTGWREYLRLGLPGTLMVCSEWWAFETVALAAGYLGQAPLAAQSIILNCAVLSFMVPLGVSVAASTRVGHLVGAGRPQSAKRAATATLFLMTLLALVNTTTLWLLRDRLAGFFTPDPEVGRLIHAIIPIVALFQLADGINGVAGGVLRGVGRQTIGAAFNLFAYYGLALPIGIWLAFGPTHWGLAGLWWGLCLALMVVAACESAVIVCLLDWDVEIARSKHRLMGLLGDEEVSVSTDSDSGC